MQDNKALEEVQSVMKAMNKPDTDANATQQLKDVRLEKELAPLTKESEAMTNDITKIQDEHQVAEHGTTRTAEVSMLKIRQHRHVKEHNIAVDLFICEKYKDLYSLLTTSRCNS